MASPVGFTDAPDAPGYADRVSARLLANDMASLMQWTLQRDSSVTEHIDQIFAMAALEDTAGLRRASMVLNAIEEQEKFLKEKRARKSVKLVRAAQKALEVARKNNGGYNKAQALAAAAFVEDAIAYVLALDPPPEEFVCVEPLMKRRLRLRQAAPKETKAEVAQQRALDGVKPPQLCAKATQRILIGHARRPAGEEDRPWLVEAAGDIFATPPLRSLSEKTAQRYYIAIPPELEKKVLTEGYHPTKRSSVPVSASPAQAVAAYLKVLRRSKEERAEVDKKRKENQSQSEDSLDDRLWDLWEWTSAHELFPVLSEDQRGVRAAVLSVQVEDASCAYQWLVNYAAMDSSQVDPEQIYVFGRSLGGCVTVRLLSHLLGVDASAKSPAETSTTEATSKLPLPAGILLENSPSCIADVATHMLPFLRLVPRSLLTWPLLLDEWRSSDWLDWIGQALSKDAKTLRLCLLSATHDKVVPASCMEELRRVGQKHGSFEVSFHGFQRGDHMGTYLLAGEHYWHCLRNFLRASG
eukprot:s2342_g7.t1